MGIRGPSDLELTMNLEEIILQNGFYVIGRNSSHLGVNYSILVYTKPQIDIYNGCQYAAFTEVGECIAIGSESGDSGMASHGGWTWIKDKLDNRYIKTVYPPRNEITVKLGIAEPVVLTGGQWDEYSQEKDRQEKLKNPWKPALY